MLIDFTLKNYTSFKDEKTFSFLCDSKHVKEDVAVLNLYDKFKIYPTSVLLGPNASGKTNFFRALSDLADFVKTSYRFPKDNKISAYKPYKLNSSTENAPITFDIEFTHKNRHFSYIVVFNQFEIISEELYLFNNGKKLTKSFLFKRSYQEIVFGSKAKGEKTVYKTLLLPNRLLLSVIGQSTNEDLIQEAYNFFAKDIYIIFPQYESLPIHKYEVETILTKIPKSKNLIIALLKAADLQISDIEIKQDENIRDFIKNNIKPAKKADFIVNDNFINMGSNKTFFGHHSYNVNYEQEKDVFFNLLESESSGTKKLYELSVLIILALISGSVLIIDELSSCFHPNIESFIVELFSAKDININGAQLLINTHNVNIIDNGNFTREQVWFTDRNKYGESDLFCLDEFDSNAIRDYAKYGKSYLENRVGGVPNICLELFKEAFKSYYSQKN